MIKISSAKSVVGNNKYTNELITWEQLRERFRETKHTRETMAEYKAWATEKDAEGKNIGKPKQTAAKDADGAFIGGWLEVDEEKAGVHRNSKNLISRSFLNFDFDNIDNAEDLEQLQEDLYDSEIEFILYSTHSHTPDKPRVRVLLPLDREVNKEEFEAISRLIVGASDLWAKMIDTSSFDPAQAMFYATTAKDAEYIYDYSEGTPIDAEKALKAHKQAYNDTATEAWHEQPKVPSELNKPATRRNTANTDITDPTTKPSYIGAFNRAYNIHEAIEKFIPDKYSYDSKANRYTWEEGSSANGAVVYDDFNEGDHLFSNHETDPAFKQMLNAFDLVRLHLYGKLDEDWAADTPMSDRLSYKHMINLAEQDEKVMKEMKTIDYKINLKAKETDTIDKVTARKAIDTLDFEKDTIDTLSRINPRHVEFLTDDEEKQLYLNNNAGANMHDFKKDLIKQKEPIETGFPIFDRILDGGLHEGLYMLGAISSLGKTTFVLQMADQIAKTGHDVLFFSLEMSTNEIKAKSISRITFENVLIDDKPEHKAKTVRGISDLNTRQHGHTDIWGKEHPPYSDYEKILIDKSIDQYEKEASNLYIVEGVGNIGAAQIKETVEKHIKYTGNAPVVIVDYLQILAPADERLDDKRNMDRSVFELKKLSRDYAIPIFGISSFNRDSYKQSVSMVSFKESGAIEYSSDVLIGLQFSDQRKADEKNKTRTGNTPLTVLDQDEQKSREPRQIELKILKNRNGITGVSVDYDYYAKYNSFKEKELVSKYKPKYEFTSKEFSKNKLPTV